MNLLSVPPIHLTGAFYQISNETTLGQSEEEIVDRIRSAIRQIVEREREERRLLMEKNGIVFLNHSN